MPYSVNHSFLSKAAPFKPLYFPYYNVWYPKLLRPLLFYVSHGFFRPMNFILLSRISIKFLLSLTSNTSNLISVESILCFFRTSPNHNFHALNMISFLRRAHLSITISNVFLASLIIFFFLNHFYFLQYFCKKYESFLNFQFIFNKQNMFFRDSFISLKRCQRITQSNKNNFNSRNNTIL